MELEKGIYVGCALTHAPEEFIEGIVDAKLKLKRMGYEVLEFKGLKAGDAEGVYRHDIEECVEKCGAMLAVVDYASLGLGYEIATTSQLAIPTLMVAQVGREVSRLMLGAAEVIPTLEFERYRQLREVPEQFDRFAIRRGLARTALSQSL